MHNLMQLSHSAKIDMYLIQPRIVAQPLCFPPVKTQTPTSHKTALASLSPVLQVGRVSGMSVLLSREGPLPCWCQLCMLSELPPAEIPKEITQKTPLPWGGHARGTQRLISQVHPRSWHPGGHAGEGALDGFTSEHVSL